MDKFYLDVSLVAHLGGYSAPRFPDMTITFAVIQMVEKFPRSLTRLSSSLKLV